MSQGRLATISLTANTPTVVYTAPTNCFFMEVDISAVNPAVADATLQAALCTGASPSADEYIEKGKVIAAGGGTYDAGKLKLSPGENVWMNATQALAVRVSGRPVTKLN